ncbi:hypothetical protein BD626DRAFT_534375 [Schizophyllum amplum]|uniref:Uncharacterized protein n=1 Tax=Schizophyllum amplum TaxID=97359 RepID=A0A550CTZ2_9AGAR|nr:hypothetical protein BD626DRAFT_534375 [Auriculariopsis ampla]
MSASIGLRSPPPLSPSPRLGSSQSSPRLPALSLSSRQSNASPVPRPHFDTELLKAYVKKLLATTLQSAAWPEAKDRDRVKAWMKEIGERVKERMVEIQGKGFKYIVLTQINENLGQGGRADLVCHWEDSDAVAQEVFSNRQPPPRFNLQALISVLWPWHSMTSGGCLDTSHVNAACDVSSLSRASRCAGP